MRFVVRLLGVEVLAVELDDSGSDGELGDSTSYPVGFVELD